MTQPFHYTGEAITAISDSLSPLRFKKYLDSSGGDETAALQLYAWNTAVASAFYGPLQTLEVLLRNAVDRQLQGSFGPRWFDNSQVLRPAEIGRAAEATQYLQDRNQTPTHDRVVAELSFAFWVALMAKVYDQAIWRTDLHKLFPRQIRSNRRMLHETLDRLRTLRNRIAHHEPIHQRQLDQDLIRIRVVVGALDLPTLSWLDQHSNVTAVLGTSPGQIVHW